RAGLVARMRRVDGRRGEQPQRQTCGESAYGKTEYRVHRYLLDLGSTLRIERSTVGSRVYERSRVGGRSSSGERQATCLKADRGVAALRASSSDTRAPRSRNTARTRSWGRSPPAFFSRSSAASTPAA